MIRIFGDFERRKDGKPSGDYPGWYYKDRQQMDDLRQSIQQKEYALEMDYVQKSKKGEFKESLAQEKERLSAIEKSKPELRDGDKDNIARVVKEVGKEITDAMFTRTDMVYGLADAHSEAERMSKKKMAVKSEEEGQLCQELGINIVDGKISRKDKERVWKIGRKLLDESTNTEALRRDRNMSSNEAKKIIGDSVKKRAGRPRTKQPPKEA